MRCAPISRLAAGLLVPWLVAGCSGDTLTLPGSTTPTDVLAVSGNGQEAEPGAQLPDPLVVQVVDSGGRPIGGAEVAFALDGATDGTLSPATVRTDSEGLAQTEVRLGTTAGTQSIEARATEGVAGAAFTFTLTALAPKGGGGDGDDGDDRDGGPGRGHDGD